MIVFILGCGRMGARLAKNLEVKGHLTSSCWICRAKPSCGWVRISKGKRCTEMGWILMCSPSTRACLLPTFLSHARVATIAT